MHQRQPAVSLVAERVPSASAKECTRRWTSWRRGLIPSRPGGRGGGAGRMLAAARTFVPAQTNHPTAGQTGIIRSVQMAQRGWECGNEGPPLGLHCLLSLRYGWLMLLDGHAFAWICISRETERRELRPLRGEFERNHRWLTTSELLAEPYRAWTDATLQGIPEWCVSAAQAGRSHLVPRKLII